MFLQVAVLYSGSHQSSRLNNRSCNLSLVLVLSYIVPFFKKKRFFSFKFIKMLLARTHLWLLLIINVFAYGDTSKKIEGDSSLLQLLNQHYSSVHSPRTHGFTGNYKTNQYLYQQSPYYYLSDKMSESASLYPYSSKSLTGRITSVTNTEESFKYPSYYPSYEFWRPGLALSQQTYGNKSVGYSKPQTNVLRDTEHGSYPWTNQDALDGSQSTYHYQRTRPNAHTQSAVKNSLYYYTSGRIPMKGVEGGKLKHKKTVYPRLHKPYAMNKYPITKTVYPLYRRHYQSSSQRYPVPVPSNEILRYGTQTEKPTEYYDVYGYYATSQGTGQGTTSPTLSTHRYPTTERMDDTYMNDSGASEDYYNYNDTISSTNANYDEAEHEIDDSTSDPYESNVDENTTRGYYGDRIYMSTQMPVKSWNYLSPKNKYYIVRKTSNDDDDFETLFE